MKCYYDLTREGFSPPLKMGNERNVILKNRLLNEMFQICSMTGKVG
jgi:hypothetical protein